MESRENERKNIFIRPVFDELYLPCRTSGGEIIIRGPLAPEVLKSLQPSRGLNTFRPVIKQHEALTKLASSDDGMVFAAITYSSNDGNSDGGTLLSYITFQQSDFPWWQRSSFPELMELGALETDPLWRCCGVTNSMLEALFNNPDFSFFDKKVVFTLQVSCNWDIRGTGMSPWEYRRMMIRFFSRFGFSLYQTNDPEIREDPCAFVMARIGKEAPADSGKKFSCCCTGDEL